MKDKFKFDWIETGISEIDSQYLNKYNNALTALMKKSKNKNTLSLRVIELKNVIRSKHAEWADEEF